MCALISDSSSSPDRRTVADVHLKLDVLRARLKHATLAVVWRQWRVLDAGAATGTRDGRRTAALVDPEALVLASLALISEERRLADLLSVQRIKNLAVQYPAAVQDRLRDRLTWFATIARDEAKDLRWRSVVGPEPDVGAIGAAPRRRAGKVRATRARLSVDATLMLRVRLGFGVGVKADC